MTKSMTQSWLLAPHDPLVLGTGRRPPATLPRMTHALPLPGTLAGAMRARFVGGANNLSAEDAQRLLDEVDVRGPWLQHRDEVLVRAPAHVRAYAGQPPAAPAEAEARADVAMAAREIVYPTLESPREGEGVLWPEAAPPLDVLTWRPTHEAHKSAPLDEFVTLDAACSLLLGECERLASPRSPLTLEGRLHVTIDATSQTAEPSGLYSSPGVRYANDVGIGVETSARREPSAPLAGPFILGGESRVVAQRIGKALPEFAAVKERYDQARARRPDASPGLLMMLATPASFSTRSGDTGPGWAPPWMLHEKCVPRLDGVSFELAAVATTRFVPMSSWSLGSRDGNRVLGRQRAVRRLVPAGTVYFLRVEGGADAWLRACEHFWWRPIDEGTPANPNELIAPPHRDGYGLVIPGLFWP